MGGRMKSLLYTELDVRGIDKHGDAIDLLGSYETIAEARANVPAFDSECVAWVIERHTAYAYASGKPDVYNLVDWSGDRKALRTGGWIE